MMPVRSSPSLVASHLLIWELQSYWLQQEMADEAMIGKGMYLINSSVPQK